MTGRSVLPLESMGLHVDTHARLVHQHKRRVRSVVIIIGVGAEADFGLSSRTSQTGPSGWRPPSEVANEDYLNSAEYNQIQLDCP